MKDVLAKEMEEYVSGYYDYDSVPVMQYVPDTSYGSYGSYNNPTRIFDNALDTDYNDFGNENFVENQKKLHRNSDLETAAAALDVTLSSIGEVGLSFLATVVSMFSDKYDSVPHQSKLFYA